MNKIDFVVLCIAVTGVIVMACMALIQGIINIAGG